MSRGYVSIVLHSHLPYVLSHGRWPHGTDWLSEAAAETYLPILRALNELVGGGFKPKLTIGLSPVLCEQLHDETFRTEFIGYCQQKLDAAAADRAAFERYESTQRAATARMWEQFYTLTLQHFNNIEQDILAAFRRYQDDGYLEIITCGATHGYLPLLSRDESVQVQVKQAVSNYEKHFGRRPRGIWLPECAYRPRYEWKAPIESSGGQEPELRKGVDEFLSENGLDYFIVDAALLRGGKSMGVYIDRFEALRLLWKQYEANAKPRAEEPEKTPREAYRVASGEQENPTAVYTRDPDTGVLVWSGEHGYPGDGNYLEFHKKHHPGGLRYWKVTSAKSDLGEKEEYSHENAIARIDTHAEHFVNKIAVTLTAYHDSSDRNGILVAPYDAELFGHWWFEGPLFLTEVIKNVFRHPDIEMTFLGDDLDRRKPTDVISLPEGSWGQGNHHFIWLNEHTDWTWKHIYECEAEMCRLARWWTDNRDRDDHDLNVILRQAARELMLLQSSDWQFLISTWSARDYAETRVTVHYEAFRRLADIAQKRIDGREISDGEWLFVDDVCRRDRLFQEIDLSWWAELKAPATVS